MGGKEGRKGRGKGRKGEEKGGGRAGLAPRS